MLCTTEVKTIPDWLEQTYQVPYPIFGLTELLSL